MKFKGKLIPKEEQLTSCKYEYLVKWKNVYPSDTQITVTPLIMGFDIEVNSSNPSAFPTVYNPLDKVFQISCILSKQNEPPETYQKYLLTLGNPDQKETGEDVTIIKFDCEPELLVGFTEFIRKHKPNMLVGYNIMGFDFPYMIERAKLKSCFTDFDQMGLLNNTHAPEKLVSWTSSAYKNQVFQYLDIEGILILDLLSLVRRDYKFNNYQLKTVSAFFLKGVTKHDLSPKGIFKCYELGMQNTKKGNKALGVCGKYCVQDSILMNMLVNKLQSWIGLCEMSAVCRTPMLVSAAAACRDEGDGVKVEEAVEAGVGRLAVGDEVAKVLEGES